jgi:hypothetical protein
MPHRAYVAVLLCGLTLAGCSISILPNESGTNTSTTGDGSGQGQSETGIVAPESTTSPTSTGDPTSTGATSTTVAGDDTGGFIITPDGGGGSPSECDPYAQDCADGQKCTWWANNGGSVWNATKCVPIAEDPAQIDEPCVAVGGGVSGEDNCDKGLMCWDVDAEGSGICIAFCLGSEREPTCPPGYGCVAGRDLALCIDICDPLAQDCAGDDLCLPIDNTYLCVLDASGELGKLNDPCEYANACDKGLICLGPQAASECDQGATGCCQPMCHLNQPDCPGAGQICEPIYEPQPPLFEHIGYCTLPL